MWLSYGNYLLFLQNLDEYGEIGPGVKLSLTNSTFHMEEHYLKFT